MIVGIIKLFQCIIEMSSLEETYRKIDPEGILNMGFVHNEIKSSSDRNGILVKDKNGGNPLDA